MFFADNQTKIQRLIQSLVQVNKMEYKNARNEYLQFLSLCYRNSGASSKIIEDRVFAQIENTAQVCLENKRNQSKHFLMNKNLSRSKEYFVWPDPLFDFPPRIKALDNRDNVFAYIETTVQAMQEKVKLFDKVLKAVNNDKNSSKQKAFGALAFCEELSPSHKPLRYFAGGNIVLDLFGGVIETVGALLALTAGLIWMVPALLTGSPYFATPTFILDTMIWLVSSVTRVIAAVVFPVAMLYSKYTTDSYNVFKGKTRRMFDSLKALALVEYSGDEETQDNEEQSQLRM